MPRIEAFYSRRETRKRVDQGVYHNNSTCRQGRNIKLNSDNRNGTGNYRLCADCDDRNFNGRLAPSRPYSTNSSLEDRVEAPAPFLPPPGGLQRSPRA
jgi:hypothetical protein